MGIFETIGINHTAIFYIGFVISLCIFNIGLLVVGYGVIEFKIKKIRILLIGLVMILCGITLFSHINKNGVINNEINRYEIVTETKQ